MAPFDPQSRIVSLERELAWANLKIQALTEELRQYRVKLLGPRSETLSDLQLELLADQEPGTTLDEVAAEAQRAPLAAAPARGRPEEQWIGYFDTPSLRGTQSRPMRDS